jgi:hypothetical protein
LRGYAYKFDELLGTPVKRFWFLNAQLDRLNAEEDLRAMHWNTAGKSPDAYEAASKAYQSMIGQIEVWERPRPDEIRIDPQTGLDPEFDREALRAMKRRLQAEKD